MEEFNRQFFLVINADPDTSIAMLNFAKFIARDLILAMPLLLAGLWLWGNDTKRSFVLKALAVTTVSLVFSWIIGQLWHHPRPFEIELGQAFIPHAPDSSFPSDHTTIFASVGFSLFFAETRKFGIAVLIMGLAAGWARIFLGIHFPFDVAGAFVLAGTVCYALTPFWKKYGEKITALVLCPYRIVLALAIRKGWIKS